MTPPLLIHGLASKHIVEVPGSRSDEVRQAGAPSDDYEQAVAIREVMWGMSWADQVTSSVSARVTVSASSVVVCPCK
ncbi:hypothetical protein BOSEA31B_12351 [Hyphomicrobiales bacterium]|nr:hypothetical protein BOSEA31B_12351 [Hyphomicrobiales bacterium]CAH1698130.1 hypothetical protein BOSEA1005_11175 [Hyphomicrobiales bacterium]CAI0347773.1 hypothetical protein BO1005MUT1_90134 [Hyphomicrobiales bacterium]